MVNPEPPDSMEGQSASIPAGATTDREPPESLMATTIRGIGLAGAGFVSSQVLNFAAYLVLVRLLTPHAYGVYAAGTLITGIGGLFAESGMLAALIKREDRLDEAASTAFAALAITGVALTLGSLALSPLIGLIFHSSEIATVTAVLSGWLLVRALTIVPDALLQRRFSFLRRVIVDPVGVIAYAAVAIPLAVAGAGVWAMVSGAYASILVELICAWIASGFRPRRHLVSVAMWRELTVVTRPLVGGEIARRLASQVDVFVLGRFRGAATLGQYRNGQMLSQQPGGLVSQVASYVILPAFARLSVVRDRVSAAARHAYWVASTMIVPVSLACLPLGVPVAVIFLGERWRPAGHVIAALSGMLLGNTLMSITAELMKAIGALQFQLRVLGLGLVLMVATVVPTGLLWGLLGVSVAVSVTCCVTVVYAMLGVAVRLETPARGLFAGLVQPAIASVPMIAAMLGFASAVSLLDHSEAARIILLIVEIVIGGLVYCGVLAAIDGSRRRAALGILQRLRRRWGGRPSHPSS